MGEREQCAQGKKRDEREYTVEYGGEHKEESPFCRENVIAVIPAGDVNRRILILLFDLIVMFVRR